MKFKSIALALITALSAVAVHASPSLITNGGFESSTFTGGFATYGAGSTALTGWTIGGAGVDLINSLWQPAAGSYSLDLSGPNSGTISQTFSTVVGQLYHVSFDMAGNPVGPDKSKMLMVSLSGTPFYTFDSTGKTLTNMGWTTKGFDFIAAGTSSTLAFASLNASAYGPALDNISVSAVPEPETYAMLLAGRGRIGSITRGRHQKLAS